MEEPGWYHRGEVRMPWLRLGGADTPVVVALPGLTDGLMPLSEERTRRGMAAVPHEDLPFRLLLLSYRHPLAAGTRTRELAADVAAFVRDVVGHAVAVTGHSMGGMVAQWLAADHPELVTHLALTATAARPDEALCTTLPRWLRLVEQGRWREFYVDANTSSYRGRDRLRRQLLLRVSRAPAVPHLVGRHRVLTEACLSHDSTDVVGGIRCPTLVLAGSEDPVVGPGASRDLARAIPDADLTVLDGLAHGFPEQAAGRTYRAVADLMGIEGEAPV